MKSLKYVLCFEEYNLAKNVQLNHDFNYHIDAGDPLIKQAIRKRATFCVRHAMFKVIPKLHRPGNWKVFKKAFKIGWHEQVFGAAVLELFKGFRINTVKLVRDKWSIQKI
jgi:hypothetical protein